MTDIVSQIRHFVELNPREDGIKGLIKLQSEVSENMKYKCRVACLHLMEMTHDWQGIRRWITEWKLVRSFGRELAIRMRKRVGEEPGAISDDIDEILKELDRLNDKNWKQFSPKKNFPDYGQYVTVTEASNRDSRSNSQTNSLTLLAPDQKKQNKSERDPSQKQERLSNFEGSGGSIFSRLSQLQKGERRENIVTRGVFSKQLQRSESGEVVDRKQRAGNSSNSRQPKQPIQLATDTKKNQNSMPNSNSTSNPNPTLNLNPNPRTQLTTPSKTTPAKSPKKVITLKYGNQKQKIKEESKDEFSFSAVKGRQIAGGASQKKGAGVGMGRAEDLDNSFLNFTNQSRVIREGNQAGVGIGDRNVLDDIKFQDQYQRSAIRQQQAKPLYTQQELNLIQPSIPAKNYIKRILEAQGNSAIGLLRARLHS